MHRTRTSAFSLFSRLAFTRSAFSRSALSRSVFSRSAFPLSALVLTILAASCAKGGSKTSPTSEVKLAQSEHLFGFKTNPLFAGFPIKPSEVLTDRGILILSDDSTYRIGRSDGESAAFGYQLGKNGSFSVTLPPPSKNAVAPRYSGAFGVEGSTGIYYFTDRYSTGNTDPVGIYWGTKVVTASADLTGDWHAFTLHTIFATGSFLDPDNVGRTASGSIAIDGNGAISGTGVESTKSNLTFSGTAKSFADGRVDLTIGFKDATTTDSRVFLGAAAKNIVLGVDEDRTDGESGLLALLRKRTGRADLSLLEGEYWIGMQTLFVNASRPGSDAAHGTLSLTAKGAFRIEATGASGKGFVYSGTYTLADDGKMELQVGGTNEKWFGAVDQDYKTVVILDPVLEQRSSGNPELNLGLALRKAVVP